MGFNIWQLLLVLIVVILLFGRGRIPALIGDIASGIKSFKRGLDDEPSSVDMNNNAKAINPSSPPTVQSRQAQEDTHA
ncbi:twin-arginine translocase TatA/TatE family subunit [Alteromonas sp. C1M14]|uniref:twin-arginine translocase TatA/TatE family subunit n=1 Tax=Alteromonas sp. C1M14 TaxID=2841567 RepID=UPI001C09CEC3|nr:twin-arginine translocase TatA/TatE family subunit [Alteromonas sp. C1M14]MBU2977263.1 twin-arginine translocase TatA/TatE family subunit [Alteromonas sp. C1M14]